MHTTNKIKNMHTHIRMHAHAHTSTHAHVHARTHAHTHPPTHTPQHTHIHICTCSRLQTLSPVSPSTLLKPMPNACTHSQEAQVCKAVCALLHHTLICIWCTMLSTCVLVHHERRAHVMVHHSQRAHVMVLYGWRILHYVICHLNTAWYDYLCDACNVQHEHACLA